MPPTSDEAPQESPFPLTEVDRHNLSLSDSEFKPNTWEELKTIIAENKLETLRRYPSDLKRYLQWSSETKAEYGSVQAYIMKKRLAWTPLPSSTPESGPKFETKHPEPFHDSHDFRCLPNDWPYGLDTGIVHLIVWTKHRLESEPVKGDMTPKSRKQVGDFVRQTFVDRVQDLPGSREKVLWFKNWTALQSVPGMEHIHILVRDVPEDVIAEWTNGEHIVQGDETYNPLQLSLSREISSPEGRHGV